MKKLIFLSLSLILIFVTLFGSCTPAVSKFPTNPYIQPTSTITPPTSPVTQSPVTQPPVITPSLQPTKTPSLDPGLSTNKPISLLPPKVQYSGDVSAALNLNASELALLQKNGFVVTDRMSWDRFLDAYAWIYSKDLRYLLLPIQSCIRYTSPTILF
jgi:hypothetical protein